MTRNYNLENLKLIKDQKTETNLIISKAYYKNRKKINNYISIMVVLKTL